MSRSSSSVAAQAVPGERSPRPVFFARIFRRKAVENAPAVVPFEDIEEDNRISQALQEHHATAEVPLVYDAEHIEEANRVSEALRREHSR